MNQLVQDGRRSGFTASLKTAATHKLSRNAERQYEAKLWLLDIELITAV